MAEDAGFNIKRFMERVVWTPTWISNGHFAARKVRVQLGIHLTSNDAVTCAFPKTKGITEWTDEQLVEGLAKYDGVRVEFRRSAWRHDDAALFLDDSGNAAWFDADYCDALKLGMLYGPAPMFAPSDIVAPYYDAPTFEESAVVIMPMKVAVDWDMVARSVAAATSIEEPRAADLVDMPVVPDPEEEDAAMRVETMTAEQTEEVMPLKT